MERRVEMSNAESDLAFEAAVLRVLLATHPGLLSRAELQLRMTGGRDVANASDAVDRAIGELAAFGLVHRHGPYLMVSQAAVRLDALLD